jgi:hypothetical protein
VKRKTFYHLALLLPYSALLVSVAFVSASGFTFFEDPPASASFLIKIILFFTFSAIIWAPFYTWMALALLFWGRGKRTNEIRRMYLLSPILLGCAMGLPVLVVDIRNSTLLLFWGFLRIANLDFIQRPFLESSALEEPFAIGVIWMLIAALCTGVGYGFVGFAWLIEWGMKKRKWFEEDNEFTYSLGE